MRSSRPAFKVSRLQAEYVGREALLEVPTRGTGAGTELLFGVRIVEVKASYGQIRVLVEPLNGEGQAWVLNQRLLFED